MDGKRFFIQDRADNNKYRGNDPNITGLEVDKNGEPIFTANGGLGKALESYINNNTAANDSNKDSSEL